MDILGLGMADGADLRVHPTGKAVLGVSCQTQGQGHETTFAQIVAAELGLTPDDVEVVHGDTDPDSVRPGYLWLPVDARLGCRGGDRGAHSAERARIVAAAMLEASADDLEWANGRWQVRGDPEKGKTIAEIAMAAHSSLELPDGVQGHLDAGAVYNPPNLTYPYGAYICVVDAYPGTGVVTVRRFIAVDDCGVRVNPMIVEGQIHRGLADGIGMALMQAITFDADGNCLSGSFMDYLLPTSVECPSWELSETVTPCAPSHRGERGGRVGHRRITRSGGERRDGMPGPYGVRHADMPLTPANVWSAIQGNPLRTDLALP